MEVKEKVRERERRPHRNYGETRTKQSESEKTEIRYIMAKYHESGTHFVNTRQPNYGDFSEVGEYHEALNRVLEAQLEFSNLPSEIRTHFDNDPGKMLDAVFDENRREELDKLGLLKHTEKVKEAAAAKPPESPPATPEEPPTQTPT